MTRARELPDYETEKESPQALNLLDLARHPSQSSQISAEASKGKSTSDASPPTRTAASEAAHNLLAMVVLIDGGDGAGVKKADEPAEKHRNEVEKERKEKDQFVKDNAKKLDAIAATIIDQKTTELPTELRKLVEDTRTGSKSMRESKLKAEAIVDEINSRLVKKSDTFLEIKSDGHHTELALMRFRNWREQHDRMRLYSEHASHNAGKDELAVKCNAYDTLNRRGKALDVGKWSETTASHVQTGLVRAYREMGDGKAFRQYLDEIKKSTGSKIYYQEDNGALGVGAKNLRIFVNRPWSDKKIFDRNDYDASR